MSLEKILTEAKNLPAESRAILAEQMVASIGADIDSQITATQLAEVRRRRDEIHSGRVKPINGLDALAQVRAAIE